MPQMMLTPSRRLGVASAATVTEYEPPLIYSGFGRVVASGTVSSFNASTPISITFGPSHERLTVVFAFRDEVEPSNRRLEFEATRPQEVTFTLINYYGVEGDGTTEPIKLGTINRLSLYINFRVYSWRKGIPRLLHYTLYERDDEKAHRLAADALLAGLGLGHLRRPPKP
jgi:hypothetical protein